MMRDLLRRSSLTTKATLVVSGALALGFTGLGLGLTWQAFTRARDSQREVASTLAESLALSAELALAVGDHQELNRLATAALSIEDVAIVRVLGRAGEELVTARGDEANDGEGETTWFRGLFRGQSAASDVRLQGSEGGIEPVGSVAQADSSGSVLGSVRVQLRAEPLIAEARRQAIAMLTLAVVAGTAIALIVNASVRRWTRRLDPLVKAAGLIREGELDTPLVATGHDEIALLASAMESMRGAVSTRDFELRTINDNLQARVEERTQELLAAKLAAEAASEAKSLFLASMSHEIRTPMTAILGYADLMTQPQSAGERQDCVGTIRRNGEHLLSIINDILDISKIEAGKMEVEIAPCEPAVVLAEVDSLLQVRAQAKGLKLSLDLETPIPATVRSDAGRLRQILVNLIGNAVKYTERGQVLVRVSFTPESDGADGSLRVVVRDTGIGMSQDQLSRLFQPFVQGDASMARRFGGTGLGLAIASRLANLLGGDISASSTLGQGSEFTLTIRTGDVNNVRLVHSLRVVEGESADPDREHRAGSGLRGAHVLLAEDGPDNQRLITHILRSAGVSVELAPNGSIARERAVAAWQSGAPFDLIIMDMQMPEMDGYTAASLLRQAGYRGPIIALTAHAMVGDREKCIAAGCDDYSTKPIQRDELLKACRKLIDAQRARNTAAA